MSLLSSFGLSGQPDLAPAPAAADTIHVTTDYTMNAGESLDVIGSPGFKITVKNGQYLHFEMDGAATVDGGARDDITGIMTSDSINGAGFFRIGASGLLKVSSKVDGAVVAGVRDMVYDAGFANLGTIWVTSARGSAFGMVGQGEGGLSNSGMLEVHARDQAVGQSFSGNSRVENDATVLAEARHAVGIEATDDGGAMLANSGTVLAVGKGAGGAAIGALCFNGVDVDNSGTIMAVAKGVAAGFILHVKDSFSNDGAIIGIGKGADPSFGLVMENGATLFNDGLIKGDIALAGIDVYDLYAGGSDPASVELFDNRGGRLVGDVMLGGGDDSLTNDKRGSIAGNVLLGDGDDSFDSSRGVLRHGDVLGGLGDDHIAGSRRGDILYGDEADDALGGGNDLLRGLRGGDELIGGQGRDTLVGGAGADTLDGGSGDDVFVFARTGDSHTGATDLIGDLTATDVIDLSRIDADTGNGGDQAFHLVSAFSNQAGELVVSFNGVSGNTEISGDVDGDGSADLTIVAVGDQSGFTNFVF